jgi:cytidylate kinase
VSLVAISAAYGAGGSRIGPAVAERLGVPFVDRAIPLAVAHRLDVSPDDAAAHDNRVGGSWIERLLRGFVGGDAGMPTALPPEIITPKDFRHATEEVIRLQASTGKGVILGRGAVVVLRSDPRVLRVRLTGPPERRVGQAMRLGGIKRETAEEGMRKLDRAHAAYLKHFYGVDRDDPSLYHLVVDSTALSLDCCVRLIVDAAAALTGRSAART